MAKSEAFEQAVDEVVRIWSAADHLDGKILQFASIITAGALAGAGILGKSVLQVPWQELSRASAIMLITLCLVGVAAYGVFIVLLVRAAIGIRFGGPLNPRTLADRPGYLADDPGFERDMLESVAKAFEQSTEAIARKIRLFRRGLWALGLAFLCALLALIITVGTVVSAKEGRMDEKQPTSGPEQPTPAPDSTAPDSTPPAAPDSGLTGYTIERGAEGVVSQATGNGLQGYEIELGLPRVVTETNRSEGREGSDE